jgi:hypothetical protein
VVTVPDEDKTMEWFHHPGPQGHSFEYKHSSDERQGIGMALTDWHTGDVFELLSNLDGVFLAPVTPDGQGAGIGPQLNDAAMKTPGGIDLSAKQYELTVISTGGRTTQVQVTDAELPAFSFTGATFQIESLTPFEK